MFFSDFYHCRRSERAAAQLTNRHPPNLVLTTHEPKALHNFRFISQVVKKSLVTFVNKHLNKINLDVYDLDAQFSDGVFLCLLMGLLEGYFVPLYDFHLTPQVNHYFLTDVLFCLVTRSTLGFKPLYSSRD